MSGSAIDRADEYELLFHDTGNQPELGRSWLESRALCLFQSFIFFTSDDRRSTVRLRIYK